SRATIQTNSARAVTTSSSRRESLQRHVETTILESSASAASGVRSVNKTQQPDDVTMLDRVALRTILDDATRRHSEVTSSIATCNDSQDSARWSRMCSTRYRSRPRSLLAREFSDN